MSLKFRVFEYDSGKLAIDELTMSPWGKNHYPKDSSRLSQSFTGWFNSYAELEAGLVVRLTEVLRGLRDSRCAGSGAGANGA